MKTRRKLLALVLMVLCGSLVLTPGTVMTAGATEPSLRIMIVGDSVTQGSSGDFTWRYRLWTHLKARGVDVDFVGPRHDLYDNVNDAHGSFDYVDPGFDQDHAAQWGASLSFPPYAIGDLVSLHQPDVVLVLLGVNDLTWLGVSPSDLQSTYEDFVTEAQDAKPDTDLVLGRVPNTNFPGVADFNERLLGIAQAVSTPESRVVVAGSDEDFAERQDTWDAAHPNALGEVKIAAAMADAMAELGVGAAYPRPLPDVPLGPRTAPVLAASAGDGRGELVWSGSPGSTGEHVWLRDVTEGGGWTRHGDVFAGSGAVLEGLTNGHVYAAQLQPVKGWWAAEPDVRSNVVEITPMPTAPDQVGTPSLSARANGDVTVSWSPVANATEYAVWGRNVTRGAAWSRVGTPSAITGSEYVVPRLRSGDVYAFKIQPWNAGVAGEGSPAVRVRVPLLPPVRRVGYTIPARGTVAVRGEPVGWAWSYRVDAVTRRRCGDEPRRSAFKLVRRGLAAPRYRFTTDAGVAWVRLRAVRTGVPGRVGRTSVVCARVQ